MKKLLLTLLTVVCAVSSSWATDIVWKWTSADASLSCSDGSSHNFTSVDGNYTLTFVAGGSKDKIDATGNTVEGTAYTHQLYMNGATNSNKRVLSFTGISGDGYLTLVTGTSAGGKPVLSKASNTTASNVIATITNETGGTVAAKGVYTSDLIEDLDGEKTYYVCFPTKCYLYSVIWTPFTGVAPASMTVTPSEITSVPSAGDVCTVEYSIKNPVQGATVSASSNVSWINSFDYSIDGEVSFTVDANNGDVRNGIVTLSYNDGDVVKNVNVSQKKYLDRSVVYDVESISFAGYQNDTEWDMESEWSSSDISSNSAYYMLYKNNYLESPTTSLEKATSLKITVNMRTVGGVSGNSAKLDIKYGDNVLKTLTASNNSLNDYTVTLTELPSGNGCFKFVGQSTDGSHGVGIRNITFEMLGEKTTISAAEYATYYNANHAYVMPSDCDGYVFTAANGLELAYESGETVPAGEPLVLYTIVPGTKTLEFTTSSEETYKENDMNDLQGAATTMTAAEMETANPSMGKFYALSLNSESELSSVGFYWINEGGAAFDLEAGKAYLALPADAQARAFVFNNESTGIQSVQQNAQNGVAYNLAGQRVTANAKGIVIMNGKKYLNK